MSEMYGFWFDLDGNRLAKLEQWELREAKRLWHRYADIRTGNFAAERIYTKEADFQRRVAEVQSKR